HELDIRSGCCTRQTIAVQVVRSIVDNLLLKHARSCGGQVREGWTVSRFTNTRKEATVEARGPDGATTTFTSAFLVDASGRSNFTGNSEGLRVVHPHLKKLSIFGHFENVALD